MLNTDIPIEEVQAYVLYKELQGQKLSKKWYDVIGVDYFDEDWADANEFVKRGLLYYHRAELLPAFIYFAENVYERKTALESSKDDIIEMYGQATYDNQKSKLDEVVNKKLSERKTLDDTEVEKRLIIKPLSEFARSYKIKTLIDEKEIQVYTKTKKGEKVIDFKGETSERYYNRQTIETMSLIDAFKYWLKNYKNQILFKQGTNWLEIIEAYLDKRPKPAEMDKTQWSRITSRARAEGDRLFGEFLANWVTSEDKKAIETIWNDKYNGYVKVDYYKVPVAFTCAKKWGNSPMEVKPEKREAVAFTMLSRSGIVAYDVGVGKGNLLTSNICTPTGWRKMGDIKVGDTVIGKNGYPTRVLGVFPLGSIQSYKITFSDGSFTEVSEDHIWSVQTIHDRCHHTGTWRKYETKDLIDKLYNYRGDYQFSIPMVSPVQFERKELPLHPYVLGVLLGDGCLNEGSVGISNPEMDIIEKVKSLLPESVHITEKHKNALDWTISRKANSGNNEVLDIIRGLKLDSTRSNSKFIPDIYKFNSPENRLELLRGLIDTDGWIQVRDRKGCTIIYTTVSEKLKNDITFLIQSFGGTVSVKTKIPNYTHNGEKRQGQLAYNISIRLPQGIVPVSSEKQLAKFEEKTKYKPIRFIESIESIGFQEAQCIKVEAFDELYVCDDFIVTHNTPSAIFAMSSFLDAGYCKRPLLVVPNQVYRQFKSEIVTLAPHLKINDLYNMGADYINELRGVGGMIEEVAENSISIMTYEGFEKLGFSEATQSKVLSNLYDILNQGEETIIRSENKNKKQREAFLARLESILGRGMSGTMVNIEDLGFDFMCVDEAHALKKVFTRVKGKKAVDGKGRGQSQYAIQSGTPSTIAIKAFCISRYIADNNYDGNTIFLTATPFTNSPLEVFSMLALAGYKKLENTDLNNLNNFFDTYVQVNDRLVVNSRLQPERRQIFDGWNNLGSLQQLIFRFIDYKDVNTKDSHGNRINLKRPSKWVFPLKNRVDGTEVIPIDKDKQVETNIQLSPLQQELMANVTAYAEGEMEFSALRALGRVQDVEVEGSDTESDDTTEVEVLDEGSFDDNEKKGVRILRAVNFSRSIALNPYLFDYSGLGTPSNYKEYVEASPKMLYTMECIKSVKKYHEEKGTPVSGQIIYMDRGKNYFHLVAEYLVKVIGYKPHEIGVISSGMPGGKTAKEDIKNKFLGLKYNEETQKYTDLPDEDRIKVIIGSSSIKEGMNLQRHTSVLYNLFLDWNPTDMIQLEGRCWRQGNLFNNVRIVVPLMEDSMDIFMFQKLSEKTKRINAIYESDIQDTNVLPVDEFDPEELKYSLITDPYVLAKMKVDDIVESLNDKKYSLQYEKTVAENNKSLLKDSVDEDMENDVRTVVNMFRGEKERSKDALIEAYTNLIKTQKDSDGNPVVVKENNYGLRLHHATYPGDIDKIEKLWGFDKWRSANIALKKKLKDWFAPKGVDPSEKGLERFIHSIDAEMLDIDDKIKHINSKENQEEIALEFIQKKKELKLESKTYHDRAIEFAGYNYLLDDKQEVESIKDKALEEVLYSCPPTDKDGNNRIDKEAIDQLEKCNEELTQTKLLNTEPDGETYTEERKILHAQIISDAMVGAVCMEQARPIAILTGGAPGSGKTTFLTKYAPYLTSDKIFHLDQDSLREKLPEYKGWNASQTHYESKDISRRILENISNGKPCKFDILYDGTMNTGKNYIPLIESLRKLGYDIYVIYLKIPYQVSVDRVLNRYKLGGKNGRYVPMSVINEYFENEGKTFEKLKPMVDGWLLVDGETQEILDNGGNPIPSDRNYIDGKPADLSEVLNGQVKFVKPTRKPKIVIESVKEVPAIKVEKVEKVEPKPVEPIAPIEVEPELSKVDILKKKIKVFETLLKIEKKKDQQQILKKKINTFGILLKMAEKPTAKM